MNYHAAFVKKDGFGFMPKSVNYSSNEGDEEFSPEKRV